MSTPPSGLGNILPLTHDVAAPPLTKKKKPGRTPSAIWQLLTDEADPQRRNSASCKHCKQQVLYYKKSEQAIRHLKKCQVFQETQHQQAFMTQFHDVLPIYQQKLNAKTPAKKRVKTEHGQGQGQTQGQDQTQVQVHDPDQVQVQVQQAQVLQMQALQVQTQTQQLQTQLQTQSNATLSVAGSALDQAAAQHAHAMNQLAMQQSMPDSLMDPTIGVGLKDDSTQQSKDRIAMAKDRKRNGPLNKPQSDRFEEALAMHAYTTGMAFEDMEDCHLARAISILRPNVRLPEKKRLEEDLLHRCYDKMHKQ
ncbi:hypothetical protein PHYBOEH_010681 [Phytophthora boehmeriae]|uniref:BED-type domain-containing protein n=1 Tax=Phytophthora boehmeriae TaxID=109152 RepID=A0A8T1VPC0_9STRA|nr:hypothetical protein PHYBOEH_010681 [Phytophthora boehmeriae]